MKRIIVLAVLISLLSGAFTYIGFQHKRIKETEAGRDAAIAQYQNVVKAYTNAQGEIVTLSKATELSQREYKKALESKELQWLKKFRDYKRAVSASSFTTLFAPEDLIQRDTVYIACKDSVQAWKYEYVDEWNTIKATVLDTPVFDQRDKYYFVVTPSRPKRWFIKFQWSKWDFNGQIVNSNKLIKADSIQTILVK
jgi:hypothetical protein